MLCCSIVMVLWSFNGHRTKTHQKSGTLFKYLSGDIRQVGYSSVGDPCCRPQSLIMLLAVWLVGVGGLSTHSKRFYVSVTRMLQRDGQGMAINKAKDNPR